MQTSGDFIHRTSPAKMEEETLKFIRQKRPRLQCKGRAGEEGNVARGSAMRRKVATKRSASQERKQQHIADSSEEEPTGILEFSPERATAQAAEEAKAKASITSIAGKQTKRPISGLSPIVSISSSTSCIPKSSSSTGPISTHATSPVEYEIQQTREPPADTQSLTNIDMRLEAITERMQSFETDLCNTVDAILDILGHKPKYVPEPIQTVHHALPIPHVPAIRPTRLKPDNVPKRQGPRLVKSQSELERVLQNVAV